MTNLSRLPKIAAAGAFALIAGSFDFAGWESFWRFVGTVAVSLAAVWTLLAKIWAPYKIKRDKAKADAAAVLVQQEADAARKLREEWREMIREEIQAAGLNRVCDELVELRRFFAEYDDDLADLLLIITDRTMMTNDSMRVLYHFLQIKEPPIVEDTDSNARIMARDLRTRISARRKVRAEEQESAHPRKPGSELPDGRRKTDPKSRVKGSEL